VNYGQKSRLSKQTEASTAKRRESRGILGREPEGHAEQGVASWATICAEEGATAWPFLKQTPKIRKRFHEAPREALGKA